MEAVLHCRIVVFMAQFGVGITKVSELSTCHFFRTYAEALAVGSGQEEE
jgi:hypothetical protein